MAVRLRIPSAKRKPVKVRERFQDRTEEGRTIQGRSASALEWAAYVGLKSIGYTDDDILFQVPISGGRNAIGGGQVLDFVVTTGQGRVIIDVRGRQFHGPQAGRAAADRFREIQAMNQPDQPKYVIIWEEVAHNWGRLRSLLVREVGPR